jgi:pimeloyl-ACP methyl ester carboxylesterase
MLLVQCPAWGLGWRYLVLGLEPLQQDFVLVFFQPRGSRDFHSPQEKGDVDMNTLTLARDIDSLRIHLQLDFFATVLGHSHGGTIALAYAELFPSRVRNLILLDHRLPSLDDTASFKRFRQERRGDHRYEAAYQTCHRSTTPKDDLGFTGYLRDIIPIYFADPEKYVPSFRAMVLCDEDPASAWCSERVHCCNRQPEINAVMKARLADIRARTLIIFGSQDAQCSVENGEATERGIPNARLVRLENCGHFPWIEQPLQTFAVIRAFLCGKEQTEPKEKTCSTNPVEMEIGGVIGDLPIAKSNIDTI